MDQKVMVLRSILEAKDVLFGGFSNILTKKDKRDKWEEIAKLCHSLGVISAGKDYNYVRDAYWPNIKKATMAKIDNARKTGSAGGACKKLTAVDELVLEILGKDSPTVVGLQMVDTMAEKEDEQQAPPSIIENEVENHDAPIMENPENKTKKRKTIVMEGSNRCTELLEINKLKKKKLELEIENIRLQNDNIRLQNHKIQLEIYEKEKSLNIKSQYTDSLYTLTEDELLISNTCEISEDGSTINIQE